MLTVVRYSPGVNRILTGMVKKLLADTTSYISVRVGFYEDVAENVTYYGCERVDVLEDLEIYFNREAGEFTVSGTVKFRKPVDEDDPYNVVATPQKHVMLTRKKSNFYWVVADSYPAELGVCGKEMLLNWPILITEKEYQRYRARVRLVDGENDPGLTNRR